LKVTFDLADDTRLTEWQSQRKSQSVELFAFSFFSQAAISAFAESSASSLGLVAPNPVAAALRRGAPRGIERAVCKRFRIEMRPELNRDYQVEN